jgi:hypothetical protein
MRATPIKMPVSISESGIPIPATCIAIRDNLREKPVNFMVIHGIDAETSLEVASRQDRMVGSHDVSFLKQRRLWIEPTGRSTASLARFIIPLTISA